MHRFKWQIAHRGPTVVAHIMGVKRAVLSDCGWTGYASKLGTLGASTSEGQAHGGGASVQGSSTTSNIDTGIEGRTTAKP